MAYPTQTEIVTGNPATGEELGRYPTHDAAGIDAALVQTHAAAQVWRDAPLEDRLALLHGIGKLLTDRREMYAALITAEMGKPISEALAEVDKCAWNCGIVADLAPDWLADHEVALGASVAAVGLRGAMLRSPEGYRIELLHRDGSVAGIQAADPGRAALTRGFGHIALDVPDVDVAYAALARAGATGRMSPRPSPEPGVRMAYVADPEGNLIELLDRTTSGGQE